MIQETTFLFNFMENLSPDIKKEVGWISKEDLLLAGQNRKSWNQNTKAVLKTYGYLKYLADSRRNSFELICKCIEKEFCERNITYKEKEGVLRQLVQETIANLILEDSGIAENLDHVKVLTLVRASVEKLKLIPKVGEIYFLVLNTYYLENAYNLNSSEILQKVKMSRTNFYRLLSQALNELSNILWNIST